jgi:hypothetical protein
MQFVRAPDENVYIAPFNLVEMVISGLLEWWVPRDTYEFVNDCVMATLYSPLLFVAAWNERRDARKIRSNRSRGEDDDDRVFEWEQFNQELDMEGEGWTKTCEIVKPNVEDEPAVIEVRKLRTEVEELKTLLSQLTDAIQGSDNKTLTSSKSGKGPEVEDDDDQDTSEATETQDAPETSDTAEAEATSGDNKQGKKKNKKNKKKGPGSSS